MIKIKKFAHSSTVLALIFSPSFTSVLHAFPGLEGKEEMARGHPSSRSPKDTGNNNNNTDENRAPTSPPQNKSENQGTSTRPAKQRKIELDPNNNNNTLPSSEREDFLKNANLEIHWDPNHNNPIGPSSDSAMGQDLLQPLPLEIRWRIYEYLGPKDLRNLQSVNLSFWQEVDPFLMRVDERKLADIKWLNGPEAGTLENFKFNQALVVAYKLLLLNPLADKKVFLMELRNFGWKNLIGLESEKTLSDADFKKRYWIAAWKNVMGYMEKYFKSKPYSSLANTVLNVLENARTYALVYDDPYKKFDMSCLAPIENKAREVNTGENILMRQIKNLVEPRFNPLLDPIYGLLRQHLKKSDLDPYIVFDLDPVGSALVLADPAAREFMVKRGEETIRGTLLSSGYDWIFKYAALTPDPQIYREAATAHSYDRNFQKEAELIIEMVEKFPDNLTPSDYREAANAYFKRGNFFKALEYKTKLCELAEVRLAKGYRLLFIDFGVEQIDRFCLLHIDFEGYKNQREAVLESDLLAPSEKEIYKSIFKETSKDTLQALKFYIEKNRLSKNSLGDNRIHRIIWKVATILSHLSK